MGFGGTKPSSSCSVASSALLETGSTPGRAACPWGALGFADGDRLLPPSSSGLLLGRGSARTERFPTRSPPAASARFTQLPTVSCSTAPESQGRRVSHPGGRAAHIWIAHIWMAELLSAAFAEAPTGEEHENPLATQRGFRQSAGPIRRTVIKPGAGASPRQIPREVCYPLLWQRAEGGKNHGQCVMPG